MTSKCSKCDTHSNGKCIVCGAASNDYSYHAFRRAEDAVQAAGQASKTTT